MLEQGHLLLQLLRVVYQGVLAANVLPIRTSPLHIVEVEAVWVEANLCRVVEEDACCFITEAVAEAVLGRVVNPLLHPDLVVALHYLRCTIGLVTAVSLGCVTVSAHCLAIARQLVVIAYRGCLSLASHLVRLDVARVGWDELANVSRRGGTGKRRGWQQTRDSAGVVDPLMHHDIVNSGSLGRVIIQNLGDQVPRVV